MFRAAKGCSSLIYPGGSRTYATTTSHGRRRRHIPKTASEWVEPRSAPNSGGRNSKKRVLNRIYPIIESLDPEQLTPSGFIRISSHTTRIVPRFGSSAPRQALHYGGTLPFPKGSSGFLYFHRPNPCPNVAFGSLRFRIVPRPDPRLFEAGHDLMMKSTGKPWGIHLASLKSLRPFQHIYQKLMQDGIITQADDLKLTQMLASAKDVRLERQHKSVLESILDTFSVDFSKRRRNFLVLDSTTIYKLDISAVWTRNRTPEGKLDYQSWYSGTYICAMFDCVSLTILATGVGLLSTFEQDKLKPSDYCDISLQSCVKLSSATPFGKTLEPSNIRYGWSRGSLKPYPFPPRTKGFFYYRRNMVLDSIVDEETGEEVLTGYPTHVAAGQLRFRVVPDPLPSSPEMFDYGSDLMMEDGLRPWNIHALAMQRRQECHTLYDSIVPPQRTQPHRGIPRTLPPEREIPQRHLLQNSVQLILLDPDCVTKIALRHILSIQPRTRSEIRESGHDQSVYSGKALVRFELVNVTRKNNVPSIRLAIRILQWIEPPDSDASDTLPVQQEGELLKKCDPKTLEERVWTKKSFVDFLPPASVQMLFDAYPNSETVTLGRLKSNRVSVQEEKV
ncbi:hypothetical protein H1R20_g4747, partial [Candolleomyces eurysporus]